MKQNTWMLYPTQEQTHLKPWILPSVQAGDGEFTGSLETLAAGFEPISLQEMESVALLDRIDTKFVMPVQQLLKALVALQTEYRALEVDGGRLNHYRTLYFDTPDFALYNLHANERADRFKVRSREYLDSGQSFLEVKHRTRKDRVIKSRMPTERPAVWFDTDAQRWLKEVFPYDSGTLESKLWNTFTRVTLVNKSTCERVTIDVDLAFYTARRIAHLDGIAVAEVKQDRRSCPSSFLAQMRALRVHPQGFSKYCIGTALLNDQVKKNSLKARLLWLERNSIGVQHD
ncbi:protein containg VTC domain [Longilinea arvoryzae]|uniref:Protein containg VTC domain n=1 Tax=Longilinea arvoryzae TaxID=360412 RepID=A0A0S7BKP7_9CHLR|nr:polyphosphate polymerase domain-containing protein [Longilinea arvoryzae]GAP15684.1 protein containg VTC domain [Longilinea arvoryzae]